MPIANAAQHSLHYSGESVYGVTNATPTWKPCPHTGTSLNLSKDAIEAEKLRGDRQIEDYRHGNKQVGGDVTGELEYTEFDDLLEAALCGTWTADVLKVGSTRRSFSFERKFADLTTPEFHRYTGVEINGFSLNVTPNAMVGITFSTVGQDLTVATSEVAGSSYDPAGATKPFDSFTGTIQEGGGAIAVITAIDLSLENGIEPQFVIGSELTQRPSIGKSRVTGTLTAFYESKDLYEKFLNETESDIVFTLVDPDGNSLQFDITRVKYNSGQPDVSGEGSVSVSMEFVGLYAAGDQSNLVITRTDA